MQERPTKKQKAVLDYIANFQSTYGYSPSYREIMAGMSYTSLGTVMKHINSLVAKGLLRKRDKSARSLEVIDIEIPRHVASNRPGNAEKWLIDLIDARFRAVESNPGRSSNDVDSLTVLTASLKVLGFYGAFSAFSSRLNELKNTVWLRK